jgi:hypothetical protein
MKSINRILALTMALLVLNSLFATPLLEAQRRGGGSFGGSRGGGSFRSSPSYAPSRPAAPSSPAPRSSFGGARSGFSSPSRTLTGTAGANAAANYRRSYGIPRQSTPVQVPGASQPYIVHNYGGFSHGLMMGYLMGHTSALWYTPFHPAFYYSRPTIVQNPDGTVEAYPPTFSFFKLFITLAVLGLIIWLVVRFIRSRREAAMGYSSSSFS